MKRAAKPLRPGWGRTTAALLGGLLLGVASCFVLGLSLPIPALNRLLAGAILLPLIWALAALGAFAAQSGARAWAWTGGGILSLAACALGLWFGMGA